jgi:hypothetical protein
MSKSNKKNINWLVDEFTSIDLVPVIKASNIKSSETQTLIDEEGKKYNFRSSVVENDELGRPSKLINYNQKGELVEEYKYSYVDKVQKIELYELGKKSCIWTYEYDAKDQLIKSEYSETADDSRDIDTYTYDDKGRLTKILMDIYPQEVDGEEPATGYELEWDGDKLMSVGEFYGEEEEAQIVFEYDEKGLVSSVKKYIYLIDDEDEDVEEVIDEQAPKFDDKGRLVENSIIYHSSGSKLVISYEYKGDTETVTRTVHKDYENAKLVRSVEFLEDENGNLLKSVEQFHQAKATKTDTFSYINK